MDELLTVKEVATILKCSEETVKRRLRSKKLAGIKTGGDWRVKQSALDHYLEGQDKQNKPAD